jgi:signal transduction histidine kinase/ActR/RegA family two-component response regulator/Tfp pilus assembly protein PilV
VSPELNRILEAAGRALSSVVRLAQENLRLRTKLLLSFVLLTVGITCVTLLLVRHNAESQAQQHIAQDAQNATLMFQVMQRHQLASLSRKADLLAWLASMRDGDATSIDEASQDPWQSEDCDLFVLTDSQSQILALHSTSAALHADEAQQMLTRSVSRGEKSGWWFGGKNLYQVVLQPYYQDVSTKKIFGGYVVVGRSVDDRAVGDLARIASSDIVFRYGQQIPISTLTPLQELELGRQIHDRGAQDQLAGMQVNVAGERYFATSLALTPGLQPAADLIVLKSYKEATAYLARLNRLLFGVGFLAILVGGTVVFFISDNVIRPLASLVKGVEALELGDFNYPLQAGGKDEISTLTRAFDRMRGTLKSDVEQRERLERQLRQAQKMEALGRLAGGVAHDFNNLLTVIRGHSELILDRLRPGDALHSNTQQIRKTADRAASLTRQMLAFSRMQVVQPKILDVNDLISELGKLLRRLIREDIEFSLRLGNSLGRIKADAGQIEQVLLNLTVNASDAMPQGGKLTIETQSVVMSADHARTRPSIEPGNYILVSVTDTGQGMNAETLARIFEPFFTTKEPGKGTGLGLATVYGAVKQSGGFIWVESELGAGTRFEIYLPQTNERMESSFSDAMKNCSAAGGARKTILVVEDEREVREIASEFLSAAGYSVLTAQDGKEALETAQRMGGSIQAVLTDVVMPHMRGPELGLRLKTLLPNVKIVYMTGYLEQNDGGADFLEDAFFLQKPFSRETVVNQIAQALNGEPSPALEPTTRS